MRPFIAVAALLLYTIFARADSVYNIQASATFTTTQPCIANCTEQISLSFQYDYAPQPGSEVVGTVLPGTLSITASGFLGDFSSDGVVRFPTGYLGLFDSGKDEIDLTGFPVTRPPDLGQNTMRFTLYGCSTATCVEAFGLPHTGGGLFIGPTSQSSFVSAVPEPTSFALMIPTFVYGGLRWRGFSRKNRKRSSLRF